jgi:hypothetical protein
MVRTDPDAISAVERERNVKMIYVLLFLILFAILFPKALRFLFALLLIGGIMAIGEVRAAPNFESLWHSVNDVCHSDSNNAERACNQITVLETMMKDNGCKLRHTTWVCPKSD